MKGITFTKLIITIIPQKLNWPQHKRYPKNPSAIERTNKIYPIINTEDKCLLVNFSFNHSALEKCNRINKINMDEPMECNNFINHPLFTSMIM